ncbi:MAG: 1-acyl-sn-glycerol-3-phosphate acyltransferase [Hyphomicrobiales bacterium]|nr:1-acyl-sn-glycerol-3-phosphate acyltransferase [Hyphomicrobiales bacterium]MCP5371778.1 1-acyl-sn-glycerol-3-phosphate acyltransferase [Hyphomicrobiales bacterium]
MTLVLVPVYLAARPLGRRPRRAVAAAWFRAGCALSGLVVTRRGAPCAGRRVMYASNHVSYLDIPVIGAAAEGTFVAKSEVAGWPLFGYLAKLADTVFIRRDPKEAARQRTELARRLGRGERLILFPEGTTSIGRRVLPFRSSLMAVAEDDGLADDLMVQPVSIAYRRYADGRLLYDRNASLYAWHGDATLLPHLLTVFGLRGAQVVLTFHDPVRARDFADRKALARHCEGVVERGVYGIAG